MEARRMRVGFVVISRRFIWQPDVADMEVGRLRSARSWRRRELWEMQSLPEGIRRADEVIERNGDFRSWHETDQSTGSADVC